MEGRAFTMRLDDMYLCDPDGIPYVSYQGNPYARQFPLAREADRLVFTPLHYHPDMELLCFTGGTSTVRVNAQDYAVEAGDIILVHPYDLHSIWFTSEEETCSYLCVNFSPLLLEYERDELPAALCGGTYRYSSKLSSAGEESLALLLDADRQYQEKPAGWRLAVRGDLLLFFSRLEALGLGQKTDAVSSNIFAMELIRFLEEHYADPITSARAAEALNYTHSYFCRKFRKHFSYSFEQYLQIFRVRKAKQLMEEGERRISGIAMAVGFNSPSYFTETFHHLTGKTPTEYLAYLSS